MGADMNEFINEEIEMSRITVLAGVMHKITCECGVILDRLDAAVIEVNERPKAICCSKCLAKNQGKLQLVQLIDHENKWTVVTWNGTRPVLEGK